MTTWWKCDLQVATPGEPRFRRPDEKWNPDTADGRLAAAERYMVAAAAKGIEVLALADHNSVEWVDTMQAAGRRHGIVVFPGFEVTSGTGADGVHLLILGAPDATREQLELLLSTVCDFGQDHPRFEPRNPAIPLAAPRTLPQILDRLPDDFLAIAPHVFGENGLVSMDTVRGSLRWKALHHDRLGAVDVGDLSQVEFSEDANDQTPEPWKARFVRRQLTDFPCLPNLPFISTSDAYSLDKIGSRFTWIRMVSPTLEALRQAFLDHEARIVCDWDPRYRGTPNTPNDVTHAWIEEITLNGLTTAAEPVTVKFDPRMTVLIGGRGSGKSTIVAGLRCLYGDLSSLPEQARTEAEQLESAVFSAAAVAARHHLPYSGESQTATWTKLLGSRTSRADGRDTPTDFKARIVSQKELFERAANTRDNPHATSRNLLLLVDEALASTTTGPGSSRAFSARVDELRTVWVSAARLLDNERTAVAQLSQVEERVDELHRQVDAFDNEANRARRTSNDQSLAEAHWLDAATRERRDGVAGLLADLERRLPVDELSAPKRPDGAVDAGLEEIAKLLERIAGDVRAAVSAAAASAEASFRELTEYRETSAWQHQVNEAVEDSKAYLEELAGLGLDPNAYGQVRDELAKQEAALADLNRRTNKLRELEQDTNEAWASLEALYEERHAGRQQLLDEIAMRSGMLRFTLQPASDAPSWAARVRELLSLRSDGFLEDVPALSNWLWGSHPDRESRLRLWREACITGDFSAVTAQATIRTAWGDRLRGLDPLVRTRLAADVADETVSMEFRRDDGGPGQPAQWEALTSGSPGQRSSAMLSFVLHQGNEPLILDQPEDDLDTEWITQLVVSQLRYSRWHRQTIIVTHNANIPVNADAERIVVMENVEQGVRVRVTSKEDNTLVPHCGAIEDQWVRADIQQIMEGGVEAFVRRERRYNNELSTYRTAMRQVRQRVSTDD